MAVLTVIGAIISFIFFIIGKVAFIWAPILVMWLGFELWHHYVTERFILGMSWTLFEIEVPRDVEKSPLAMELIFTNAMYHASIKGLWEIWIQGAPHFWFSLEIAGIEGKVHFYIRSPSRIRDLVETQIYAQYPQAKVKEVEDYTLQVPYEIPSKDWYMWGAEFRLLNHDALPIRTYKDYGLDLPSDKEVLKIDPLTPTIEYLGSLPRGQQVWIQHVIRPSKKEYHGHGHGKPKHHGWVDEAHEEIERQLAPYRQYRLQEGGPMAGQYASEVRPPRTVEERLEKIREKMAKLGFDIGIRIVTLADARYNTQAEFDGLRRSSRLLFRQYNAPDANSIIRCNPTQFDSPFADPTGLALWEIKNRMLTYYRLRTFYHPPLWFSFQYPKVINSFFPSQKPNISVMNTEEIATLFHFPGQVSQAPAFQRIESKVAKPPSNLPI
ncbi:MAG: hypothetical protein KA052_01510 [Candidatus Pacebacteria bacterium]|nr:hypothetical protein [Candidatus Paceibacterota bacterium]